MGPRPRLSLTGVYGMTEFMISILASANAFTKAVELTHTDGVSWQVTSSSGVWSTTILAILLSWCPGGGRVQACSLHYDHCPFSGKPLLVDEL